MPDLLASVDQLFPPATISGEYAIHAHRSDPDCFGKRLSASEKPKTNRNPASSTKRRARFARWFSDRIDLEKSKGSYLYDAAHEHRLIDLYGFFGSNPVGFNTRTSTNRR